MKSTITILTLSLYMGGAVIGLSAHAATENPKESTCPGVTDPLTKECKAILGEALELIAGKDAPGGTLKLEKPTKIVALSPHNEVSYIALSHKLKNDGEPRYGGLVLVTVPEDGVYRISSQGKGMFDFANPETKAGLDCVDFQMKGMHHDCPNLQKAVSFSLKKGQSYVMEIYSAPTPTIKVILTKR